MLPVIASAYCGRNDAAGSWNMLLVRVTFISFAIRVV